MCYRELGFKENALRRCYTNYLQAKMIEPNVKTNLNYDAETNVQNARDANDRTAKDVQNRCHFPGPAKTPFPYIVEG